MPMQSKILKYIGADDIRKLLNKANEMGIKKESIVQIVQANSSYLLIYEGYRGL